MTRLDTHRAKALAGFLGLGIALSACASGDIGQLVEVEPADALYNAGLADLNAGDMKGAKETFQALDNQHPYSTLARQGVLLTAFASYKAGDYDSAIASARRFVTLHPNSEDAAYAQYLIGESYFRQIRDVTRDQATTQRALNEMGEVARLYPDSEYADDARRKVEVARDQIAGHQMQVGRYYLERRRYTGAINRFRGVVEDFQTTRHVEEALYRLVEAYLALGIASEAQTAAAVLGHNYPDSRWYQDAFSLLGKGGLAPNVNEGSWLARTIGRVART
ncbi:MAG: outer membrane protein assembly factor BamD [Pseudomonadota bacterium]